MLHLTVAFTDRGSARHITCSTGGAAFLAVSKWPLRHASCLHVSLPASLQIVWKTARLVESLLMYCHFDSKLITWKDPMMSKALRPLMKYPRAQCASRPTSWTWRSTYSASCSARAARPTSSPTTSSSTCVPTLHGLRHVSPVYGRGSATYFLCLTCFICCCTC